MSEYDIYLLGSFIFACLGCISLFSGAVDGRLSTSGIVSVLLATGMGYFAYDLSPNGFEASDIPNAFIKLFAMLLN